MSDQTLIETQFPVSKLSKESYKERKAGASQTLTGLGKWWGRKPLVLIRAVLLGLLIPASNDPKKDREIFLKLMTMDEEGLWRRRRGNIPAAEIYEYATDTEKEFYFTRTTNKWQWKKSASREDREHMQRRAFNRMGYDKKLTYCRRPEEIDGPSEAAWKDINAHLKTNAITIEELCQELSRRRFGHITRVGDSFCGGGSVPFEAARMGLDAFGSELSPVAALLTWASLNITGGGHSVANQTDKTQEKLFALVKDQVVEWGIERNKEGWIAEAFLYCHEVRDPVTNCMVPLAPSWIIAEKPRVLARLIPDLLHRRFRIEIIEDVSSSEFEQAKREGTWIGGLRCPVDKEGNYVPPHMRSPISADTLRGREGLRLWENNDLVPRPDDVFQERLYCIRWLDPETGKKHYMAPTEADMKRQAKVLKLLQERFADWQEKGYLPSRKIESGSETDRLFRERGWTHWHHLFHPRQLLLNGLFQELAHDFKGISGVAALLLVGRFADWNSRLSVWLPGHRGGTGGGKNTFLNQALNTSANYCVRSLSWLSSLSISASSNNVPIRGVVDPCDCRQVNYFSDVWITDPPYADAVNYEELSEFFLAWYEGGLKRLFPEWYTDSKRALAVKGSTEHFRLSMVDCYKTLTEQMPQDGFQIVMFTHQNADVWSDLAMILWSAGLKVTAAWTIQTETPIAGIKQGNYVQGTALLILRKRTGTLKGDMSDIYPQVMEGVKRQLQSMLDLDDKDDPNFGDADYQLAAYAAALRVVTAYSAIEDIDVERELRRVRRAGESSPLTDMIRSAVRIASDFLVPDGLDKTIWKRLSPEERFYLKGIEVEAHGEYRDGVYQEFARGFGVRDYRGLIGSNAANQTRLKTPGELKGRDLSGEGFAGTLLRQVLFAVYKTSEEDDPRVGLDYLKQEIPNYWDRRQTIIALLNYLSQKPSVAMTHWKKDVEAAHLLLGAVEGDGV